MLTIDILGNILQTSNESSSSIQSKYVSGFRECAKEVANYLEKIECLTPATRSTLMQHLASQLQQNDIVLPGRGDHLRTILAQSFANPSSVAESALPVNNTDLPPSGAPSSASVMYPVQLIPAKLATGQTVYVLANTVGHSSSLALDDGASAEHRRLKMSSTDRLELDSGTSRGSYEAISPVASPKNDFQATMIADRDRLIADVAENESETKATIAYSGTFDANGKWPLPTTSGPDFTQPQQRQRQQPSPFADNALDNGNQYQPHYILLPSSTAGSVVGNQSNMWRPW